MKRNIDTVMFGTFWFVVWWIGHILGVTISQTEKATIVVGCFMYTLCFLLMAYLFFKNPENYADDETYHLQWMAQVAKANFYSVGAMLLGFVLLIILRFLGYIDYHF